MDVPFYDLDLGSSLRNNVTGFRFTWVDTDISGTGGRYFYYDSIALIGLLGIALIGLIKKRG